MVSLDYELRNTSEERKSFAELMAIKQVDTHIWQSTSVPFTPMPGHSGVFGGHVLAQSIIVGAQTVNDNFVCVGSSNYFIRSGNYQVPFVYFVKNLRTSHKYCQRLVTVYQYPRPDDGEEPVPVVEDDEYVVFVATMSFKRPETNDEELNYQKSYPKKFRLSERQIKKLPLAFDGGTPFFNKLAKKMGQEPQWHPLDVRKMDTSAYNHKQRDITNRRIIHHFKSLFELEGANLNAALVAYVSDRNSLFTITEVFNPKLPILQIASINHTIIFHVTKPIKTSGKHLLMETWTDRATDGRALYNGRIYDANTELVASFMQDGVMKVRPPKVSKRPAKL